MKNKIQTIHFEALLPFSSPDMPHEEYLPNIKSVKDLMTNYKKTKNKYPNYNIEIIIDELCSHCGNLVSRVISLKELKNLIKNNDHK